MASSDLPSSSPNSQSVPNSGETSCTIIFFRWCAAGSQPLAVYPVSAAPRDAPSLVRDLLPWSLVHCVPSSRHDSNCSGSRTFYQAGWTLPPYSHRNSHTLDPSGIQPCTTLFFFFFFFSCCINCPLMAAAHHLPSTS